MPSGSGLVPLPAYLQLRKSLPVNVVEDRSTAIVAAICIGRGELELALLIDERDNSEDRCWYGISRIDRSRSVGIGYIDRIDGR